MTTDKTAQEAATADFSREWMAELPPQWAAGLPRHHTDNPVEFALFGLARQQQGLPWTEVDWSMRVLDLGPGNKVIRGAIRCDAPFYNFESPVYGPPTVRQTTLVGGEQVEHYSDGGARYRCFLPFEDNSIGGIYAVNIFEHLHDPRPILKECARVLDLGCPLNIFVPHALSGMYLQDLDHKKPFILDTWKNWLDNEYWGPVKLGQRLGLTLGANFTFGIKEENTAIITQLVKTSIGITLDEDSQIYRGVAHEADQGKTGPERVMDAINREGGTTPTTQGWA